MSLQVELISRRGCHLCDELHTFLERLRAERPFALRILDVDRDPGLYLYYSHRVPVLRVNGEIVSELRFAEAPLRERLLALLK